MDKPNPISVTQSMRGGSSRLSGICLSGNRKVPGSMPGCGILLLLFPWARNFTPMAPPTRVENGE